MSMPRRIEHEGQLYTVRELAAKLGISITAMESRIRRQEVASETLFVRGRAKRQGLTLTWNGETHTIAEWSVKTGVSVWNIYRRITQRWPLEKVFTPLVRVRKTRVLPHAEPTKRRNEVRLTWNGKSQTLPEWSRELGIPLKTLQRRFHHLLWSTDDVLGLPVFRKGVKRSQVRGDLEPWESRQTFARPQVVKHDTTMVGAVRGKPSQD
jgi:hypothetical protein